MRYGRQPEEIRFSLLIALLAACFLMGGASRFDVTSLILLQPLAAICATAFLLIPGERDWRVVRTPLVLLTALASVMTAQLIPLPPVIWVHLPGHGAFAQNMTASGLAQPWRPMSLTPDLTLASLIGLIVPLAVLAGFASTNPRQRHTLLAVIIGGSVVSALFGLAQVSGGLQSPFYIYKVTNFGSAVGLFSNRNHQALLLAMTWPMLTAWAVLPRRDRRRRVATRWIAAGFAVFLLPLLLVTGSRAGLVLGVVAFGCAGLIWRRSGRRDETIGFGRYLVPGAGVAGVALLLATILLSRAKAIQRMFDLSAGEDTRIEVMPTLLEMTGDFFPVGSGFGSFDPIYRFYESAALLDPKYLNHAHNDVVELAITAGLPGMVLVLTFLVWFVLRAASAWRSKSSDPEMSIARVASVMVMLILASSLVDYPLRNPLMMAIMAIACGWLSASNRVVAEPLPRSKALYG